MPKIEQKSDGVQHSDYPSAPNEVTPLLPSEIASHRNDTASTNVVDEACPEEDETRSFQQTSGRTGVYTTISVMLVGVFLANTDASIILATYGRIASSFGNLEAGGWLLSSFVLAQCVAQPLYGKLSDIYGRKTCLQVSYLLFGLGTLGVALAASIEQIIAFRALQGAGSAGMTALVSIIITDLVPLHEVAIARSYVNVLQAGSRSVGGVIGGVLTQAIGWRWTFGVQVPIMVIGVILVQWRLQLPTDRSELTRMQKLKRIDFIGAFLLCVTIFAVCFVLDVGGQKLPWDHPAIISLVVTGVLCAIAFTISAKFAVEPIFPLRVIAFYQVIANYMIMLLQQTAQFSLMIAVPLYFQATDAVGPAVAGLSLIPAFVGNLLGGLLAGYWIRRVGKYKLPTVLAPMLTIICEGLCILTWQGHTSVASSLFTFPGGLAMGLAGSAALVGAVAAVAEEDVAVTTSGSYLFMNLGAIGATTAGPAAFQLALQASLKRKLRDVDRGEKILRKALEDIDFVQKANQTTRELIVPAFVDAFHAVNILGLVCGFVSLLIAITTRDRLLKRE